MVLCDILAFVSAIMTGSVGVLKIKKGNKTWLPLICGVIIVHTPQSIVGSLCPTPSPSLRAG